MLPKNRNALSTAKPGRIGFYPQKSSLFPRNFRTDDDVDFFINEYAKTFSTVFYENYAGSRDFPYDDQWSPYDKRGSKDFYPQMVNTPPIFEYSPRIDFTPASPYCIYDIPQPE